MLGMPNSDSNPDKGELFMEPDYSLTTLQVYTAFARRVLAKERSLRIFSAVQHEAEAVISRPSWVPQWNRAITEPLIPIGQAVNRMPIYSVPDESIFTPDCKALDLRGVKIGVITGHTDTLTYPNPGDTDIDPIDTISRIEDILQSQSQQLTLGLLRTLCWTLTVGRGNDFWRNAVDHWATFQDLWLELCKCHSTKSWQRIGFSSNEDFKRMGRRPFCDFLGSATHGRRVFVTAQGLLGLGPAALQPGDIVVALFGGFTPFVLRHVENYYLHGQMDGEVFEDWEEGMAEAEGLV
ncbi:hypothetical protein BDV95DRAFT_601441 [Massariosphaeria phaeospora]|uniref:Heterokaryon incompatibility protein-domain-containing protein n=1 Tax=Massariosphaeria phaeospora TaxID=100035 RepID=A0A7C8MU60_9PLEO|nr:hypothetical protein BDV95DRAFT_601441 [Massariosphaeria phaeospora]